MREFHIALVPGDGVGPEVIGAAKKIVETIQYRVKSFRVQFQEYLAGKEAFDRYGSPLPESTLAGMRNSDAALLGSLAGNLVPTSSPMGQLRKKLGLYADVRFIKSFPGVWSLRPEIDIVFVRENTQGFLADRNLFMGNGEFMPTEDVVMSVRVLTRRRIEQIAQYTFELARREERRKVAVLHKSNVFRCGDKFFLEIVREIARKYPEIQCVEEYVDSAANHLISNPEDYDVILTTNLFGDILSDEAAALVSNLVPTLNVGAETAVFRPIHEALLKIAGQHIVNPMSSILCVGMMLRFLGEASAAKAVEEAVKGVLSQGKYLTEELGGHSSTEQVAEAVCREIAYR